MRHKLPESYPSCELLPFNRAALDAEFSLEVPDADPGGPGLRLLLQGTQLLLTTDDDPQLPEDAQASALPV